MNKSRWVAHRELLRIAGQIKKIERRIVYVLMDIEQATSPSSVRFGRVGGSSHISDPTAVAAFRLDGLSHKLSALQNEKSVAQERFESLIAAVPPPADDTLYLYYVAQMPIVKIAIKKDLSEGTVKNHLRIGRDIVYEKIKTPEGEG